MKPRLILTRKPRGPSLSLVKKALRLFRGAGITKQQRHANARKWLASYMALGDRHVLKGGSVSWGRPGEPNVSQIHAPRRLRAE